MSESKAYLGDGVYADIANGMILLTTEDGVTVSNRIYLEPGVYRALLEWVARVEAKPAEPSEPG